MLCGYCADENLRKSGHDRVLDTGRRTFKRCAVCRSDTRHREEEVTPLAS